MVRKHLFSVFMTTLAAAIVISGCSLSYTLEDPTVSHTAYTEHIPAPATLSCRIQSRCSWVSPSHVFLLA